MSDEFFIRNVFTQGYLNFDSIREQDLEIPTVEREDPYRPIISIPTARDQIVFLSREQERSWQFLMFSKFRADKSENQNAIRGMDILLLNHPELKSDLTSDFIYHGE